MAVVLCESWVGKDARRGGLRTVRVGWSNTLALGDPHQRPGWADEGGNGEVRWVIRAPGEVPTGGKGGPERKR